MDQHTRVIQLINHIAEPVSLEFAKIEQQATGNKSFTVIVELPTCDYQLRNEVVLRLQNAFHMLYQSNKVEFAPSVRIHGGTVFVHDLPPNIIHVSASYLWGVEFLRVAIVWLFDGWTDAVKNAISSGVKIFTPSMRVRFKNKHMFISVKSYANHMTNRATGLVNSVFGNGPFTYAGSSAQFSELDVFTFALSRELSDDEVQYLNDYLQYSGTLDPVLY